MWRKKSNAVGFASGSTTLISKTTEVVGNIRFSGNLEIEGRIVGNVSGEEGSDARVRIMDKGVVEGEINVPTVVVNGQVKGDVHSSRHVELAAKAVVQGNVYYTVLEMVKGAQVNGQLMYADAKAQQSDPAGTRKLSLLATERQSSELT